MMRHLFFTILFLLFAPFSTWAVVLYLEPTQGEYYQGDTFIMTVRVDTEKECINTVEGYLSFPSDALEVVDLSQGNSILTIWVQPPAVDKKSETVSFSGGIPGGYCGKLPGDFEESNLLVRTIFKVKETGFLGNVELKFADNSQVLLNDGMGTPAKLSFEKTVLTIVVAETSTPLKEEWQAELAEDEIPPESFEIEISQDSSIFEGKYFITFSTTDKQTGVDYYEVKEGKGDWRKADSPYLLEDQKLKSTIKVRAVDKAGNARIAEHSLSIFKRFPVYYWIAVLLVIALIWILIRRKRK